MAANCIPNTRHTLNSTIYTQPVTGKYTSVQHYKYRCRHWNQRALTLALLGLKSYVYYHVGQNMPTLDLISIKLKF